MPGATYIWKDGTGGLGYFGLTVAERTATELGLASGLLSLNLNDKGIQLIGRQLDDYQGRLQLHGSGSAPKDLYI